MSGTTQEIFFDSNPTGAEILQGTTVVGTTPTRLTFRKSSAQPKLTFRKEGYKPRTMTLENRLDDYFWGNIVIGGTTGSLTDDSTGAMYQYSPGEYVVTLEPLGGGRGLDRWAGLEKAQKIKDFVIVGYRPLIADIIKGEGEYLASLLSLLEIPKVSHEACLIRLRYLKDASPEIPTFAERILDEFLPPTAGRPASSIKTANDEAVEAAVDEMEKRIFKQQ